MWYNEGMIKKCLFCSGPFITYPSKIALGRGKYCSKTCADISFKGKHFSPNTEIKVGQRIDPRIKGWRYTISRKGGKKYKELFKPNHPMSDKRGYVREHRYVMSESIGRILIKNEIVHHKDGNTLNNDINNLELMFKRDHDRMNTPLNIHKRWHERRVMFSGNP
jgi:hypothetical protein